MSNLQSNEAEIMATLDALRIRMKERSELDAQIEEAANQLRRLQESRVVSHPNVIPVASNDVTVDTGVDQSTQNNSVSLFGIRVTICLRLSLAQLWPTKPLTGLNLVLSRCHSRPPTMGPMPVW